MATQSNSQSLFDIIIDAITGSPRNLLLFMVIIINLYYSVLALIIAMIGLAIMKITKLPEWLPLAIGGIQIVMVWLIIHVSPHSLFLQNKLVLMQLIHGNTDYLSLPMLWLCAMPYGIFFAGLYAFITRIDSNLHRELKRIGKGQMYSAKILSSSRLQKRLNKIESAAIEDGTVLGINRISGESSILKDRDANLHTLAIGTTGSGKTTGLGNIIESAIIRSHPLIYVDGKGDRNLAKRIEAFAKEQQVPFYLFSMIGESLRYNPIAEGGYTSKKDRIIELRHWSEDHYRKIAEGYLQTVFQILQGAHIQIDLCQLANYLEPDALYLLARERNDKDLARMADLLDAKRKDIASLIAEIENMANSEIGHLFDCSQGNVLTLSQALQENAVVYFCLQPLAFPAYAEMLGKFIINDIKCLAASQLTKEDAHKRKIFTIFDEFSVFAGDQIINLINQGRGAGIHAVLSTQSLSDINRKGGDALVGQVLNNCNNYIIQRQNNPEDSETLAAIIGTEDKFEVTSQITAKQPNSGIGTVRGTKSYIIHPDDIKRLGLGQAILVNKQNFNVQQIQLRKGMI